MGARSNLCFSSAVLGCLGALKPSLCTESTVEEHLYMSVHYYSTVLYSCDVHYYDSYHVLLHDIVVTAVHLTGLRRTCCSHLFHVTAAVRMLPHSSASHVLVHTCISMSPLPTEKKGGEGFTVDRGRGYSQVGDSMNESCSSNTYHG